MLLSTIDEMNEIIPLIEDIISSLLENNYISLKNNVISCIIDRKNEKTITLKIKVLIQLK